MKAVGFVFPKKQTLFFRGIANKEKNREFPTLQKKMKIWGYSDLNFPPGKGGNLNFWKIGLNY